LVFSPTTTVDMLSGLSTTPSAQSVYDTLVSTILVGENTRPEAVERLWSACGWCFHRPQLEHTAT